MFFCAFLPRPSLKNALTGIGQRDVLRQRDEDDASRSHALD